MSKVGGVEVSVNCTSPESSFNYGLKVVNLKFKVLIIYFMNFLVFFAF